jgi:hypothetical protein
VLIRPEDLIDFTPAAVPDDTRPVLVHALNGFVDAGSGGRLTAEHLLTSLDNSLLATFDVDLLLDYRSRRPAMIFEDRRFTAYDEPSLALHRVTDANGTPFLLLAGPEPDLLWQRFVDAVDLVHDRFGVRLSIGLTAIPWALPHTRPLGVIAHSADAALVQGYDAFEGAVRVPGHVDVLLEYQLGTRGRSTMGFAAQVPHYLSQIDYPAAAVRLLDAVSGATGLTLPTESLVEAGVEVRSGVDAQVAASPETLAVVEALEVQYDEQVRLRADASSETTGEDIAAQFERFLAERDRGAGDRCVWRHRPSFKRS